MMVLNRGVTLALGLVFVFAAVVAILAAILPGPRKPTDYLVMGVVATLLCLVLLFLALVVAPGRAAVARHKMAGVAAPAQEKSGEDQTARTSTDL